MVVPILLAATSAGSFLALAHAAVTTPKRPFMTMTAAMALVAGVLVLFSPAAGAALLAPVLLSRRLANALVPATVNELLERYPARTE